MGNGMHLPLVSHANQNKELTGIAGFLLCGGNEVDEVDAS